MNIAISKETTLCFFWIYSFFVIVCIHFLSISITPHDYGPLLRKPIIFFHSNYFLIFYKQKYSSCIEIELLLVLWCSSIKSLCQFNFHMNVI